MAIETGTCVRSIDSRRWFTWGWVFVDKELRRVLIEPDRVYTVTVAASRFKRPDGTYQPVTKMTCPATGLEVMVEKNSIIECQ